MVVFPRVVDTRANGGRTRPPTLPSFGSSRSIHRGAFRTVTTRWTSACLRMVYELPWMQDHRGLEDFVLSGAKRHWPFSRYSRCQSTLYCFSDTGNHCPWAHTGTSCSYRHCRQALQQANLGIHGLWTVTCKSALIRINRLDKYIYLERALLSIAANSLAII